MATPEMTMTAFFITVLVITVTVYDLCIVMFKKNGIQYSVSRFVSVAWLRLPSVCFGCGFLCGHFCGSMAPPTQEELNIIPDTAIIRIHNDDKRASVRRPDQPVNDADHQNLP